MLQVAPRPFVYLFMLLFCGWIVLPVAADVQLRWSVDLPVRQTMWRHGRDLQRDTGYRAAVAGQRVFVGCEHNGALLALDAKTGDEQWRFYTNAPIRTQPIATDKLVIVGSDDGYVYCLNHNGDLRWKAAVGRSDRYVIGHQRMMSAWPVPNRPILHDGMLFVLGGCWPADGVFMNAFDVETGKRLWRSPSMAMRVMMVPLWIQDGHVYARTYSGTGGKAHRFELKTGVASAFPKGTQTPRPEKVSVPGVSDLVDSHASSGLLFGTDKDGRFHCGGPPLDAKRVVHKRKTISPVGDTENAKAIITLAGHEKGYALVDGLTDGRLVEGLLANSKLYIVAVDRDAAKVDRIRRALDRRGCFETHRLSVLHLDLKPDTLPPYFASLVLSESGGKPSDVALLSQRPYGGAAVDRHAGQWRVHKRGPLENAGNWDHEYANAAMTNATSDTGVVPPLGVLWYGGPASDRKYYLHGNRPTGALVVDGRMFLQGDGVMAAIDAYTGRLLWEKPIPKMHIYNGTHSGGGTLAKSKPWIDDKAAAKGIAPIRRARATGLNWACAGDCLYLFTDEHCLRFHPETGDALPAWKMPLPKDNGEALCWGHPRIVGDVLVATAFRPSDMKAARVGIGGNGGDWTGDRMPMSHVFALNRKTGKLLWSAAANHGFNNRAFIAGNNRVFLTDLLQQDAFEGFSEAGRTISDAPKTVRAFDLDTGDEVWTFELKRLVKYLTYIEKDDVLLVPNRYGRVWTDDGWGWPGLTRAQTAKKSGRPHGVFRAFRGKTGEKLWEVNEQHYDGPFTVIGDRVLNRYGTAFDPKTGRLAMKISPVTGEPESYGFRKSGCAVLGACETLLGWRTAYHDPATRSSVKLDGFEAGCTTSLLPASGLLNMPNYGMFHLRSRLVAVSLVHRPSAKVWTDFQLTKVKQETPIRRIGFNFAAPGDRYANDGTLWVQANRGGDFKIDIQPKEHQTFTRGSSHDWIGSSGIEGVTKVSIPIALNLKNKNLTRRFNVRMFFADPSKLPPGARVFNVSLEGQTVLTDFDITAGGKPVVVHEFKNVEIKGKLDIELTPKQGQALLCGVELIAVK